MQMVSAIIRCQLVGCFIEAETPCCNSISVSADDRAKVRVLIQISVQFVESQHDIIELSIAIRHHERDKNAAIISNLRLQGLSILKSVKLHFRAIGCDPKRFFHSLVRLQRREFTEFKEVPRNAERTLSLTLSQFVTVINWLSRRADDSGPSMDAKKDVSILVAGATGYVGGRLVPHLLQAGYRVRCLVRKPANLRHLLWGHLVECVEGDLLRPETLPAAMEGVTAVYYLVHSMGSGTDFEAQDLVAARHCAKAAKLQGVQRIIYLGALGDPAAKLSAHLRSRQETGDALREGGVPVTEFRAAVVIGSGSLSFELIRYLSERLPVMICPLWVYTRIQPIAIRNVLEYLVAALEQLKGEGRIVEIG